MSYTRIGRAGAKVIAHWRREGAQSARRLVLHKLWYWREFRLHGPAVYERWCIQRTGSAQFVLSTTPPAQGSGEIIVSIVCAVFNPPVQVLRDTIDSVLAQSTTDWELILVNAGENVSDNGKAVDELIREVCAAHDAVTALTLPGNLGISGNLNAGIESATGDVVFILDHDDLLAPNAVEMFIAAARDHPQAGVFYCDEDRVSGIEKTRNLPWFKPRTESPELMLNACYLMHSAIRRQDLLAVGGFRTECDGAQDWDLHLRLMAKGVHAAHIPDILYHWRQLETSTALTTEAKPWAMAAQERAICGYLQDRYGIDARLERHLGDMPRPVWDVPKVSVTIVLHGSVSDQSEKWHEKVSDLFSVTIVRSHSSLHQAAVESLATIPSDLLLFLDNSVVPLSQDWLTELVRWTMISDVGIVGGCVLDKDHFIKHAGLFEENSQIDSWYRGAPAICHGIYGSTENIRNVSGISSSCLMISRKVFEEVSNKLPTDASFEQGLAKSVLEHGYRIVYTPHARFTVASLSALVDRAASDIRSLDLYSNPNLDPTSPVPHLRFDIQQR